jgi:vancomycin resistance protein VanW
MLQDLKRLIRIYGKRAKNLFSGYYFFYAKQKDAHQSHLYSHLWSESITAIPDRGSPEIRKNRILNLQLAASKIHNLQLNPGQIFSFSHLVGEPTILNGFHAGPVFVRGQVQTGVGGGLCLIATNLFNTFLSGGCQTLERHCHSIDAYGSDRFYQLGEDAAVSYGYKDLIIKNHSAVSLQLRLQILPETGQVISSLWGQSACPWQVKVNSIIREELISPLADGISGWIVETQRQICLLDTAESSGKMDYSHVSVYQPCTNSKTEPLKMPIAQPICTISGGEKL